MPSIETAFRRPFDIFRAPERNNSVPVFLLSLGKPGFTGKNIAELKLGVPLTPHLYFRTITMGN